MILSSVDYQCADYFIIEAQHRQLLRYRVLSSALPMWSHYLQFIYWDKAAKIHILRIVLGSILGQTISFMYSISGGICCLLVMMLCRKLISKDFIWLAGIFSAIAHIVGQLPWPAGVSTVSVLYYAPIVLVSSIVTGFFTGLCVQFLLKKHEKTFCNMLKK
ncbi:MAG: Gx transporter family protein [Acutalibacteraceae bacterium]